ncbi:glycosyltransferase family 4 protein [Fulvivirgaceae bacterium BMA12]|uniref:Glycosyltransferase family 4 protein n=1 Tax=Agaribacillus aureus TaxID=3051825 RepID=A0ABT8L122_9BACT|nr:glycosyltransferase family 4 protein [Fulvivirgaceae bacterium BMA12]
MNSKVVYIGHSARLDGAERCFLESIRALKLKEVEVIAFLPSEGPLCEKLTAIGVPYHILNFPRWMRKNEISGVKKIKFVLWQFSLVRKFKKKLLELKPDYVITNTVVISPFAAIASKKLGIPHFWYIHEFGDDDHGIQFLFSRKRTGEIIDKYSRKVFVNSNIIREKFQQIISPDKMELLHYAVENEENSNGNVAGNEPSRNDEKLNILLLGRMVEKKGQAEAVRGIAALKQKGYTVKLTMVGGGKSSFKNELKALIQSRGVSEEVEIIDFTSEPMKYLENSDIVLMCSKCEAFGRVTVEAMKKGKPVVGANTGATPEIIKDGFNGKIYVHGDEDDLANKIIYFIDNKDKLQEMGSNARQWALENFNYDVHATKLLKFLNSGSAPNS